MNHKQRNPGPSWGYAFLLFAFRWLPRPVFRIALRGGAVVGWAFMPDARNHCQGYWKALKGHPPTLRQQWTHFGDFAETLMSKLALQQGIQPKFHFRDSEAGAAFMELGLSGQPTLFGSFHIGESDLMGAYLSEFGRSIHMIRLKVDNSADTEILEKSFGESLRFIWINQPDEMLFALKSALESGQSVALHCDRVTFGARREAFHFLGRQRWFPFTIYHLSYLFQVPVVFSFAARRDTQGSIPVVTSTVFRPSANKVDTLERGKSHFQVVLQMVEEMLHADPCLWFNFEPLNEPVG